MWYDFTDSEQLPHNAVDKILPGSCYFLSFKTTDETWYKLEHTIQYCIQNDNCYSQWINKFLCKQEIQIGHNGGEKQIAKSQKTLQMAPKP